MITWLQGRATFILRRREATLGFTKCLSIREYKAGAFPLPSSLSPFPNLVFLSQKYISVPLTFEYQAMSFPTPKHYSDSASTYPPSPYSASATPTSEHGEAAGFYGSAPVDHNQNQQQAQYDQEVGSNGERGLGTM